MKRAPFLFLIGALLTFSPTDSKADQGIGFRWDTSATEELAYSIDLSTGDASLIGTLPGLQTVSTGSHDTDYLSGVTVLLGSKGGATSDTLFLVVPKTRLVYGFKISGVDENTSLSVSRIRSSDGAVFLLYSNRLTGGGTELKKVTFNAPAGTASLSSVGTLSVPGYSIDGVKIADDGKLYILATDGTTDSLVTLDTSSALQSSVNFTSQASHQGLFLCNQTSGTPRLFSLSTTRAGEEIHTALVEISLDGSETTLADNLNLTTLAGTLGCTNNVLHAVGSSGEDRSGPSVFYTLDISQTNFQTLTLSQSNIKFIGVTQASVSATKVNSTPGVRATNFSLISAARLRKCVKELGAKNPLPKSKSAAFRAVAKGLGKIRKSGGQCVRR
jgi:hypothetical protein